MYEISDGAAAEEEQINWCTNLAGFDILLGTDYCVEQQNL
jgi:hypothetical protein